MRNQSMMATHLERRTQSQLRSGPPLYQTPLKDSIYGLIEERERTRRGAGGGANTSMKQFHGNITYNNFGTTRKYN